MTARSASTEATRISRAASVLSGGLVVVCAVLAALLVLVTPASAYWTSAGSGTGSGTTGTLAAPTGVTVPGHSLSNVAVSWTAGGGSPEPDGHYVTRTSGGGTPVAACASSPTALLTDTSCTDSAVPEGTYTYTVTAVFRSWTAASAPSGSVSVWTPDKLAVTGQPTTTVAGTSITPAVAVTVQTAAGVAVPLSGTDVTVAMGSNPGGGTLSSTSGTLSGSTNSSGVVTFAGLSIDKSGAGYTLEATSFGLTSATSATFTITAASADRFAITSTAVSGAASTSPTLGPITVAIRDAFGNATNAPTGGTAVTLSSNSTGTARFATTSGGTTTTTVTIPAGSSSRDFFYGDEKSGSPTINVTGAPTGDTQSQTITAGVADRFVITSAVITAGVASATATIGPLTVQRQDALGNPATPAGAETVTLATNSTGTKFFSATSGGSATTTVTIGANSSSVNFYYADTKSGSRTITVSGALTGTTQNATIVAAAANTLLITSTAVSGVAASTATIGPITVERRDQFNNLVTAGSTTVNLSSSSTGASFKDSVGASTTSVVIASPASTATFLYGDTKAAFPVITVGGTGLTGATQTATITPDVPTQLVFVQQPATNSNHTHAVAIAPSFKVEIRDQFNNLTTSDADVSIAILHNAGVLGQGVLSGTTPKAGVAGTATFSNLSITGTLLGPLLGNGNGYTLQVTSGILTAATSNPFNIT